MKRFVALGLMMAGLISSGAAQNSAPPAARAARSHPSSDDAPTTAAAPAPPANGGAIRRSADSPRVGSPVTRLGTPVTPLQAPQRFSPVSPLQQNRPGTRTFRHFDTLPTSRNSTLADTNLQPSRRRQPTDAASNRTTTNEPRPAETGVNPRISAGDTARLPSQNNRLNNRNRSRDDNVTPATFRPRRGGTPVVSFNNNNRWSFDDACRRNRHHHDRNWWCNNFSTIILIGGGYYAWDAGWWYPAWGYDPSNSSYSFDGPIYGYDGLPPDQVIANVQSALQELGYFPYAVDGVLGPVTRQAIADYQRDNGIYISGAIDRQTLVSLGFIL